MEIKNENLDSEIFDGGDSDNNNAFDTKLNDETKNKSFINRILNLKMKYIYILYLLWMIWFINLSIFINKDLSDLLFSNINKILLIFMMIFGTLYTILESLYIIYQKKYTSNILFYVYFVALLVGSFTSLFKNSGAGWQFHLLLISNNLNFISFLKYFKLKYVNLNKENISSI